MNPLLNNGGNPFGNITQLMSQFNNFRRTFKGNPRETVMQMVNSGQISQEQFKQAQEMAKQLQGMIGGRR